LNLAAIARDLGIATRLGARALARRIRSSDGDHDAVDVDHWRAELETWVHSLPADLVAEHRWVELPAKRPPWSESGLELAAGDAVTWFAAGRVHLSRALDIWVPPSFQLWARVAPCGGVLRGTRNTHTLHAATAGPLQLASYFPGEWSTAQGELGHGTDEYRKVSGGLTVLLLKWQHGVDPATALQNSMQRGTVPAPVTAECARLAESVPTPEGWDYLWYLGPGEIYRAGHTPDGQASLCCDTHGDVGILRRAVALPLAPGTFLDWRWRVDSLPIDLREDSLPSHDYLSIAVEFDDGQDLTYYWSSALPVGTVYRCPLPTWKDKETHVVVRSGTAELGHWLHERRDVHADYRRCIGGTARSIERVWLIANSLFQRGHGRCEYSAIEFEQPGGQRCKVL
jgi:Protein of unknown function (DUF3047)